MKILRLSSLTSSWPSLQRIPTISRRAIEDKGMNEQIDAAFNLFDVDKSTVIDEDDLKKGFNEMGMNFAADEIREMMKTVNA